MTPSEMRRGARSSLRSWLVTRPQPEADALAADLAAMGIPALVSPALTIKPVAPTIPESRREGPIDGIIFTSRNGVRFGAGLAPGHQTPVFAVGEATADAARKAGFDDVRVARGDAPSVAALIRQTWPADRRLGPKGSPHLVHPTGAVRAIDFDAELARSRIRVSSVTTYEAVPADSLSAQAYGALSDGTLAGVIVFSPRTARHVGDLIAAYGMDERVSDVYAVCLSVNVAEPIRHFPWREIVVAQARTTGAVLDVVSRLSLEPPTHHRAH